jgi:hypothetical protein
MGFAVVVPGNYLEEARTKSKDLSPAAIPKQI